MLSPYISRVYFFFVAFNFGIISESEVNIIYFITTYNVPWHALFLSIPKA